MASEDFIDWDRIGKYRVGIRIGNDGLPSRMRVEIGKRSKEYIPDDVKTCNMDLTDKYVSHGEIVTSWECSACGGTYEEVNGSYEYCPHCRAKVAGIR